MPPELLIAAFPFDRLARFPLLLCHPFEMAIAVLIQSVVRDEAGLDNRAMLPDRDHGELLHIQVDGDRDQIRIALALHNLCGGDGFALQKVNGGSLPAQNQFRALLLPSLLSPTQLKIPVIAGRVVDPDPLRACIDLEPHKALAQVEGIQFQCIGPGIKCGMVGSRRNSWLPFLLARMLPRAERGEIASRFADAILDAPSGDTDWGNREMPC